MILNVFGHFWGLVLKGLMIVSQKKCSFGLICRVLKLFPKCMVVKTRGLLMTPWSIYEGAFSWYSDRLIAVFSKSGSIIDVWYDPKFASKRCNFIGYRPTTEDLSGVLCSGQKFYLFFGFSYLMGASCGGDISAKEMMDSYRLVGLEPQHAYSVLDVKQVHQHR